MTVFCRPNLYFSSSVLLTMVLLFSCLFNCLAPLMWIAGQTLKKGFRKERHTDALSGQSVVRVDLLSGLIFDHKNGLIQKLGNDHTLTEQTVIFVVDVVTKVERVGRDKTKFW